MEDHCIGEAGGIVKDGHHVAVRIAVVDLHGKSPLRRERDVIKEAPALSFTPPLTGSEIVQPSFSYSDDLGLAGELGDAGEGVVVLAFFCKVWSIIGVQGYGGLGPVITLSGANRKFAARAVVADQDGAGDAHALGSIKMLADADLHEAVPEVQMRVIVNDRYGKGFWRGGIFEPTFLLRLLVILAAHRPISLAHSCAGLRPVGRRRLTRNCNYLTHSTPVYPQPGLRLSDPLLLRRRRRTGKWVVRAKVEGMRDSEFFGHVTALAPGKVNLSLRVGPLRADGYHEVATLYYAVSLYEEVLASPRQDGAITVSLSERSAFTGVEHQDHATGGTVPVQIPLDENNLAYQAADLLRKALQERDAATLSFPGTERPSYGVDLTITKNVPIAGGMGGGSADAAATLVACSALWEAGLTKEQLAELGARLGADVPFAIFGGAAVGQGVGDNLSPLLTRGELHLVIVPASTGLSTPEVYRKLDAMRDAVELTADDPELDDDLVRAACAADAEMITTLMANDLQAPAVAMLPALDDMMDAGMAEGAMQGMVSGSGPTVMFLARDASAASQLATGLQERLDVWAIPVSGPAPGARLL